MTKALYFLIALLILAGAGFYLYNQQQHNQQVQSSTNSTPTIINETNTTPTNTATKSTAPAATHFSGEADAGSTPVEGNDIQVQAVNYNGTSFDPATITIYVGDYIFFENKSATDFWPQSTTAGFDAAANIIPGANFKFQFNKAGTFTYTDKLNSSAKGTVIVQKR